MKHFKQRVLAWSVEVWTSEKTMNIYASISPITMPHIDDPGASNDVGTLGNMGEKVEIRIVPVTTPTWAVYAEGVPFDNEHVLGYSEIPPDDAEPDWERLATEAAQREAELEIIRRRRRVERTGLTHLDRQRADERRTERRRAKRRIS